MLQARQNDFQEVTRLWPRLPKVLSVIRNEKQYESAITLLDFLIDTVGSNEKHPLAGLLDLIGTLVKAYEDKHVKEPTGDPISSLRYLMNEHGLTQRDLSEIGSQGVVSEILHEKRKLNVRQIRTLSQRFHVSPSVFI